MTIKFLLPEQVFSQIDMSLDELFADYIIKEEYGDIDVNQLNFAYAVIERAKIIVRRDLKSPNVKKGGK